MIIGADKLNAEFIHPGTKCLGVSEVNHLRTPSPLGIEARDSGSILARRIWTVQTVLIEEIVATEHAEARICIDTAARFVVVQALRERRSGETIRTAVNSRNVLEQIARNGRERLRRNLCAGENAGSSRT